MARHRGAGEVLNLDGIGCFDSRHGLRLTCCLGTVDANARLRRHDRFDRDIEENTLDAFMHLLRNKIDPPGRSRLIHTVRGVGYMIRPDERA